MDSCSWRRTTWKTLCESAKNKDIRQWYLSRRKAACAALEADLHLAKPYDDKESLLYICQKFSVSYLYVENVPSEAIDILE